MLSEACVSNSIYRVCVSVILFTEGVSVEGWGSLYGGVVPGQGCLDGDPPAATAAVGMHPTGMHSCFVTSFKIYGE